MHRENGANFFGVLMGVVMKTVWIVITVILSGAAGAGAVYATLNTDFFRRIAFLNKNRDKNEADEKEIIVNAKIALAVAFFGGVLSAVVSFQLLRSQIQYLSLCKYAVSYYILLAAACVDFRERRIPNQLSALLALAGILLLVVPFLQKNDAAVHYVTSSVVATAGCAACLTIAALLTKGGIGIGDIKLLCALAIVCGVYGLCATLLWGLVVCTAVAIFLLLSKKKTIRESVPFAPFIFAGFVVYLLI